MLSMRELLKINQTQEVHSYQVFDNGFVAVCCRDWTIKTPVYDAAGRLIQNTDIDPMAGVVPPVYRETGVAVQSGTRQIIRWDDVLTLECDEPARHYTCLDFHGEEWSPMTCPAPNYPDVVEIVTRVQSRPESIQKIVPMGHLADNEIYFIHNSRFYQIPVSAPLITPRLVELDRMVTKESLAMKEVDYLTSYTQKMQNINMILDGVSDRDRAQYFDILDALIKRKNCLSK